MRGRAYFARIALSTNHGGYMKHSILTLLLLSSAVSAQEPAGRWDLVTIGTNGVIVSIDLQTMLKEPGTVTVWVQYSYGEKGKYLNGKVVAKTLQREEFNCKPMTHSVLSFASFWASGESADTATYLTPTLQPIVPDTATEAVWRKVCL